MSKLREEEKKFSRKKKKDGKKTLEKVSMAQGV